MKTFVGVDIQKAFSQVHVQSEAGRPIAEGRLGHEDLERLRWFFRELPGEVHVAVEATVGWMWLADELEAPGATVHLAHQKKVKAISESRLKTDSVDARSLCQVLRTGFLPEAYLAPPEVRDQRMLLRYRMALVQMKIRVKNAIHAVLTRYNVHHPFSDLFGKGGRAFLGSLVLPWAGQKCLKGWLELLEFLDKQIRRAEGVLTRQYRGNRQVELLQTIPGIGPLSAPLILAEMGDVANFCRPKKLVAYAGLAPSVHQSAARVWGGHIGQGRKHLRWALVEAAQTACWKDRWLARFYRRKRRQKGAGKALVAVAIKLSVIVWHVLKEDRPWRPGTLTSPGSARFANMAVAEVHAPAD